MSKGFWPPQNPDSFIPPDSQKPDQNLQRMQDLEDEYLESTAILLPECIDRPLQEVLSSIGTKLAESTSVHDLYLRTMPYRQFLKTDYWRKTRDAALARGHNECAICASKTNLDVHHRTYERRGCERPEDLIVLCHNCHRLFHGHKRIPCK